MNTKNWIVMPQRGRPRTLSADQSYPKLLGLIRDLENERGHLLTNKQVDALQSFVQALIDARACITCYDNEY